MSDDYPLRTLTHPELRWQTIAVFAGLASAGFLGGVAFWLEAYGLATLGVVAIVGTLVGLQHVDEQAREVAADA